MPTCSISPDPFYSRICLFLLDPQLGCKPHEDRSSLGQELLKIDSLERKDLRT